MIRSVDHVQIPLSRVTIELPSASRDALLEQIKHLNSMRDVRERFGVAGTSEPVRLTQEQKGALITVIEHWGSQVHGGLTDGLPDGIFELRNALHDDLHDDSSGSITQ
jgi:hypothetical protein